MKQRTLPLAVPRPAPRPVRPREPACELPEGYGEGLEPSGEPVPEFLMFPWERAGE